MRCQLYLLTQILSNTNISFLVAKHLKLTGSKRKSLYKSIFIKNKKKLLDIIAYINLYNNYLSKISINFIQNDTIKQDITIKQTAFRPLSSHTIQNMSLWMLQTHKIFCDKKIITQIYFVRLNIIRNRRKKNWMKREIFSIFKNNQVFKMHSSCLNLK